jgi:hypothetical protein
MDYTERPDSNQSPDGTLFTFLAELYGVIGGPPCQRTDGTCYGGGTPVGSTGNNQANSTRNADDVYTESGDGTSAQLSHNGNTTNRSLQDHHIKDLPAWVIEQWQSSVQELMRSQRNDRRVQRVSGHSSWRLLQDNSQRSVHEIDLGQNFRLQVHFLKRSPIQ